MLKRLTIRYGDLTLFDGEVAEFAWSESGSGVKAEGKVRAAVKGSAGLLEALGSGLASAQKAKTQKLVEEKKAADE